MPPAFDRRPLLFLCLLLMSWGYLAPAHAAAAATSCPDSAPCPGKDLDGTASSPWSASSIESGDPAPDCVAGAPGYLRARLAGAIQAELDWGSAGTECSGSVRPADGGVRMRFSRSERGVEDKADGQDDSGPGALVLVFGIAGLREGESAQALPVNLTVIREGRGEFYSTQGDDKCMLDEVSQQPIAGLANRSRAYRIVARGYCMEPARAVRGHGAVLLSRFDYAGRVDFDTPDAEHEFPAAPKRTVQAVSAPAQDIDSQQMDATP